MERVTSPVNVNGVHFVQPAQTDLSPDAENLAELKKSINDFMTEGNKNDIIIYEVEYKDTVYEKVLFNRYLNKHNLIHIPPLTVFLLFNVSFIIFMLSLLFLLISLIGPLNVSKKNLSYNGTCVNNVECDQSLGLHCDYSVGLCTCDSSNGYTWVSNTCKRCPQSWTRYGSYCYLSHDIESVFNFTGNWCAYQNSNAQLVVVYTMSEFNTLKTNWNNIFSSTTEHYIDCNDLSNPGTITCSDGNSVVGTACSPQSTAPTNGNKCAVLKYTSGSGGSLCWDIHECYNTGKLLPFLCKIDLN